MSCSLSKRQLTLTLSFHLRCDDHTNTIYNHSHCLPRAVDLHHGCQKVRYITLKFLHTDWTGRT